MPSFVTVTPLAPPPPTAGVLLPLSCLLKDEERLAALSACSCALVAAFCAVVLLYAVMSEPEVTGRPLVAWNPGGASISLPVMIFAFTGHSLFFPVVRFFFFRSSRQVRPPFPVACPCGRHALLREVMRARGDHF